MKDQLIEDFINFVSEVLIIQEECYKNQLKLSMEITEFFSM
jgi:hypothetical protein